MNRKRFYYQAEGLWGSPHGGPALFFTMSYHSVLLFFGEKEPRQFIYQVHLTQTLHQSGQGASCALYSELTNERERETDGKRACAYTSAPESDWGSEYICFSKHSWIILLRLVLVLRERNWEEKDKCEGERERECWRWREKWQLIGIWVSSSKSSVIQQHLRLLALKLLWDLKAPGLSCSPGTASDPCLAYTANRNAYLHQPGQLKSLPLCPRSVSVERRL